VQLDHAREIVGDASEGGTDLFARQPSGYLLEDHIVFARYELIVLVLEPGNRDQLPPTGVSLLAFTEHSSKNTVEPRADSRRVPEIVQTEPGTAASLLHRVFGVGERGRTAHGKREKTIEVRQHQRVEARVAVVE
jgi:hypothetical protein